MTDRLKHFLKIWEYQQGALFLKEDEIYALRQNLANFFYDRGYEYSLEHISHLELCNTLLNSINLDNMNKIAKYEATLQKIADIASAFDEERHISYRDYELREIAREALGEKVR